MLLNYLQWASNTDRKDGSFRYAADIKETTSINYFLIEASNATDTKQLIELFILMLPIKPQDLH